MADSAWTASGTAAFAADASRPRHAALVRLTHWITFFCFLALLVTGAEIVISHPRFYWGETGNIYMPALFQIPIPASRRLVQTGYGYVLPDQNGWSRALHFQSAWVLAFTGLAYLLFGVLTRHFTRNLLPSKSDSGFGTITGHLRSVRLGGHARSYNSLQKLTYLSVIFVLFPLVIWTGLAMSPAFVAAFPATVTLLGGQQSARTIHFFVSIALVVFLLVHVAMVSIAGFTKHVGAMITGRGSIN